MFGEFKEVRILRGDRMGRGSYLGGCTIIGPGSSWFSNSKRKSQKPSKSKKQQTPAQAKLNYLHLVVDAEIRGRTLPKVPKKTKGMLESAVARAGGALDWARKQTQYEDVREKKEKKLIKKKKKLANSTNAPSERPPARNIRLTIEDIERRIAENTEQLEKLRSDIKKDQVLLKRLESAEVD